MSYTQHPNYTQTAPIGCSTHIYTQTPPYTGGLDGCSFLGVIFTIEILTTPKVLQSDPKSIQTGGGD